jgi:hypothetical protein
MRYFLNKFCNQRELSLQLVELDIIRNPRINFALDKVRQFWLMKIQSGDFDLVLSSPPCSTFSRAPWANFWGPRPIRSFLNPRGNTWLKWTQRKMAKLGNMLADFSFEALRLQLSTGGMFIKEQPEDLGALKSGPWTGQRPASMWQFQQHFELLEDKSVRSIAIFQSDFGAQYPKPTRLLLNLPVLTSATFHEGVPIFDSEGFYKGPLPKCTSARTTLKRTSKAAPFATSGTAAWPPGLCEWLSSSAVSSWVHSRATVSKGEAEATGPVLQAQDSPKAVEEEPPNPLSELGREFDEGGFGPSRTCVSPGKTHLFHDGATLLSPGRWDKEHRNLPSKPAWHLLRHTLHVLLEKDLQGSGGLSKRCFQLAKCKQSPCSLECSENIAEAMSTWLVNHGCHLSVEKLMEIAPGQTFRLNLIREMLRAANDADFLFLNEVESTGVTVGVLEPLPRTPRAFEEQTSWRLEDDPSVAALAFSANYSSVKDHQQWVRQHLEEEVAEGLMEKITEKDLQSTFGENVAIASLAVIHDQVSDKRRLVHDATHKVKVNHRIKCRDKLRMPGPREKFFILKRFRDLKLVPFSLIADVSKAHRRVRHKRQEHGLLACKVDEADDHVFVNRVGTFGVSSAAYWWTRLFATVLRVSHYLLSYEESLEVLTYADDVELIAASPAERQGATKFLSFLTALGTPFKWEKLRGGMATDWIGFHTDYMTKELGLSTKRAEWISSWCEKLVSDLSVYPSEMASGLGRLGYAANALHWEKPFLGPIYAWSSAVAKLSGKVRLPWAVALLLKWISKRLSEGGRLQPPPYLDGPPKELFRTDAKAEGGRAYIGGWETLISRDASKCRWFSLEVTKSWAPWVWCKQGDPGRVIAALELLATIVAILVFAPNWTKGQSGVMYGTGLTDNKGNSFVLMKMLSTKFPLTILLIELSEQLRHHHLELHLEWIPREGNQEADDLTNEDFSKFSSELRVPVNPLELPFLVLPEVMKFGESLYNNIVKLKQQKRSRSHENLGSGKKRKRDNLLDPW